jgi:dihydroflavonol-4-reductase
MTLREILETLATLTNKPAPRIRLPYAAAWLFGAAETALASLTGREPRAPLEAVRMAAKKAWVSSAKAERELGWHSGPVEPALERAIQWFRDNQYC